MNKLIVSALLFCWSSLAAEKLSFPDLPESPARLIETLKSADTCYTIGTWKFDYVKDSDIPYLVELLDSKAPCAHVVLSLSSQLPLSRSTVGHEAAYLIEGFWKRYYPTELVSQSYRPDIEGIQRWYRIWSSVKRLAESNGTTNDVQRTNSPSRATESRTNNAAVTGRSLFVGMAEEDALRRLRLSGARAHEMETFPVVKGWAVSGSHDTLVLSFNNGIVSWIAVEENADQPKTGGSGIR